MEELNPELLDVDELEAEESLFRELRITADRGQAPVRIDKFLVDHVAHTSRKASMILGNTFFSSCFSWPPMPAQSLSTARLSRAITR